MSLLQELIAAAEKSGCRDLAAFRQTIEQGLKQQSAFIDTVLDKDLVEESEFLYHISEFLGYSWWNEPSVALERGELANFPASVALRYRILPIHQEDGVWHLLTYTPFSLTMRQAVTQTIDDPVVWIMSTRTKIREALRQCYGIGADTFESILEGRDPEQALADIRQETTVLDEEDSEASVIKFVNQILHEALDQQATDIHVEPLEHDLRIRYRMDGVLQEVPVPPQIKLLQESVITRLKIMADLDIAERRLPQDGRINLELRGEPIDVRVATIPTVYGETVSLRILGQEKFSFDRLNMEPRQERAIHDLLKYPNGIILVTGPTGSGKSTSLYTFLASLNTGDRRIVTIEDPVEHKLTGVMQIAVKPDIGLSFARGLRSVLRADPNVIMVGEMRDVETAEIAIRAALTGHLVFSTLHTNDAIGAITRLIDMGIEPFLVSSSVRAFVAQRLVRTLCPQCKEATTPSPRELVELGFPAEELAQPIYRPKGCPACRNTGYQGRNAIYEICRVTPRLQDGITSGKNSNELRSIAKEEGMQTLADYGWEKIKKGQTSIEEVLLVTRADSKVTAVEA
ncbi:MAG: GspE/PulE family protein [Verrucomicrobiota bacterium]